MSVNRIWPGKERRKEKKGKKGKKQIHFWRFCITNFHLNFFFFCVFVWKLKESFVEVTEFFKGKKGFCFLKETKEVVLKV